MSALAEIILLSVSLSIMAGNTNDMGPKDEYDPEPPAILRVSVVSRDGDVLIEWESSPTPAITYYELNEYTTQGSFPVEESIDPGLTGFLHPGGIPNTRPFSYDMRAIRVIDGDTTYSILSEHHTTIYNTAHWDSCGQSVELNWTPYVGWGAMTEAYRVYYNIGDGEDRLAGTVNDGTSMFSHSGVGINRDYCYYVEAVHREGSTSRSNITCLYTGMSAEPEWINADYATVAENNIELSFTADPGSGLSRYRLLRSVSPDDDFITIHEFTGYSSNRFNFIDGDTEISRVNYYLLEAINFCGAVSAVSNQSSNIVLSIDHNEFMTTLSWNDYGKWLGETDGWHIYRTALSGLIEEFAVIGPGQTKLVDDLESIHRESLRSEFCYIVEAREGPGNPYGIKGISRSNMVCIHLSAKVFFPTAFTPGGEVQNNEFFPIMLFEPRDYLFIVADRLGNRVFESRNPMARWDGRISSGNMAPEGVYLYFLRAKTPNDEIVEKKGHVVIFYP